MPPDGPDRRLVLTGALALAGATAAPPALAAPAGDGLRAIERRTGGRLGLFAQRAGQPPVAWRADERFLMCSTFKALAVSAMLARVDAGRERLDRRIAYGPKDLLGYAPVTRAHAADGGMTLDALCAAAIELSDNTAANLILARLGGPAAVTRYVRGLGDTVTRLDRNEPTLNDPPGPPADPHDSTTPASMAGLWRTLLSGRALAPASRARLLDWLEACQTGPGRLKAATPAGWRIGHKTGTGRTTLGDVAILIPPAGAPVFMACYLEAPDALHRPYDAAMAEAGRLALGLLAPAG